MSSLKIGFHAGPGGNHKDISEYYQRLDEAGIPFVIKSVDHYGHIHESSQYTNADHVRIFRMSNRADNGPQFDTPRYDLSPLEAADAHWSMTLEHLSPEFDKEKVWLEVINEPDKNRAEWLAEFSLYIAAKAGAAGYKVAFFGWSSGEPEPEHWEGEKMLALLRVCAENQDTLAIALHEYSFLVDDIYDQFPYKIGRFAVLYDVCKRHGIDEPTVLITEWGWTLNDVPAAEVAIIDIDSVAKIYALYRGVRAAAIWYLGTFEGSSAIANKTQKLIKPVTELALSTEYGDPIPPTKPPDNGGNMTYINVGKVFTGRRERATHVRLAFFEEYDLGGGVIGRRWLSQTDLAAIPDGANLVAAVQYEARDENPDPPPGNNDLVIHDIVDDLPKHPTLSYAERTGGEDDISVITVHHTVSGSDYDDIFNIAYYHINTNGWPGIAYHYCITSNGDIYQTNKLVTKSYHSAGNNHYSIGVALLGDFTDEHPSQEQETALSQLIDWLFYERLSQNSNYVFGHREMPAANTQCPGNTYHEWLPSIKPLPKPPSMEFTKGDTVVVSSNSALNLRYTPFGSVIEAYPRGTAMTVISSQPVRATGYVWWNVRVGTKEGWVAENYIEYDEDQSQPELYDIASCYLPAASMTHSDILIVKNNWGQGDERNQLVVDGGFTYVTKGDNYERYRIEGGLIFYEVDSSVSDSEMVTVFSEEGWIPARMPVGGVHTAAEDVTLMDKETCAILNQYSGVFYRQLANHHATYTIPESGFLYEHVLEVWWIDEDGNAIEKHWLVPGLGRVRWSNNEGKVSWVHEHIKLGDQENNTVNRRCEPTA